MENEHEFQESENAAENKTKEDINTGKKIVTNVLAFVGFVSICALVGIKVLGETVKGIIKD